MSDIVNYGIYILDIKGIKALGVYNQLSNLFIALHKTKDVEFLQAIFPDSVSYVYLDMAPLDLKISTLLGLAGENDRLVDYVFSGNKGAYKYRDTNLPVPTDITIHSLANVPLLEFLKGVEKTINSLR